MQEEHEMDDTTCHYRLSKLGLSDTLLMQWAADKHVLIDWYSVPGLTLISTFDMKGSHVLRVLHKIRLWSMKVIFIKVLAAVLCLCIILKCLTQRYLLFLPLSEHTYLWPTSVVTLEWWWCPTYLSKISTQVLGVLTLSSPGWSLLVPRPLGFYQNINGSRPRYCLVLGHQNSQISECSVPVAASSLGLSQESVPETHWASFPNVPPFLEQNWQLIFFLWNGQHSGLRN